MNVDKNNGYKIENIKRINIRYYLIRLEGRSYVADFANPKDIRNFFPLFFSEINNEVNVYEVTGDAWEGEARPLPFYHGHNVAATIKTIYLIYIINVFFFPNFLNLWYLTYDNRIGENWIGTLLSIFIATFIFCLILYFQPTKITLPDARRMLVRVQTEEIQSRKKVIQGYFVALTFLAFLLFFGIWSSNYTTLFLCGLMPIYSLLFSRFIDGINVISNTYKIIDKENH